MPRRLVLGNASWSLSIVSSSFSFHVFDNLLHSVFIVQTIKRTGVDHRSFRYEGFRQMFDVDFQTLLEKQIPSDDDGLPSERVQPVSQRDLHVQGFAGREDDVGDARLRALVQHGEDLPQVPDGSSWRDRAWVAVSGFAVDDVVHFDSLSLWGWRLAYALPTPQVYHTCVIFCKCLPTFPEPNRRPCRSP